MNRTRLRRFAWLLALLAAAGFAGWLMRPRWRSAPPPPRLSLPKP